MSKIFIKDAAQLAATGMAAAVLSLTALPATATGISYTEISADTAFARDRPGVDRDSKGNYHLVYRMGDAGGEMDGSMTGSNVGYMMVAPNGDVLINEVKLTTDGTTNINSVDVEVGSDDKLYVSFAFRTDNDLRLIKLDPSLAAQDGTSPTLGTITDVAEVVVVGTFNHPFIELDDADNVYAWSQNGTFTKYTSLLVEDIAPISPFSGPSSNGHGTNPIAVDSDGNVHVFFQDCDTDLCSVSYGMLDGTDGSVLIDTTPVITSALTTDQGSDTVVGEPPHAVHYNIMADSSDRMALVWADKRFSPVWDDYCEACSSGGTLHYAKIDPSLDDQDGSAADMTVIKTVDDSEIGPYKYAQAFMAKNNSVHVFHSMRGGLSHVAVSASGKASRSNLLTSNAVSFNGWNKAYPAAMADNGRVFWPRVEADDDGAGSKIVMGKVSIGSAAVASSSSGGTTGPAVLLLMMAAAIFRRRMAR